MNSPKIQSNQQILPRVQFKQAELKKAEPNFGMSQPLEFLQQTTKKVQVDEKMAVEAIKANQFAFGNNNKEVNLPSFDTKLNLLYAPDGNRSPNSVAGHQGNKLFTFG